MRQAWLRIRGPQVPVLVKHLVCAALAVALCAACCDSAVAQFQAVRPLDGPQAITHNEKPEPQSFKETRWLAYTFFARGATVHLTCPPFDHEIDPSFQADGRMDLRVQRAFSGNWKVAIPSDQTAHEFGDNDATVIAITDERGLAVLGLTVSFLGTDLNSLADGEYSTTVTGTITAN